MKRYQAIGKNVKVQLAILFLLGMIAVGLSGLRYYQHERDQTLAKKYSELNAIAKMKVTQLVQWQNERLSEARFFSRTIHLVPIIKRIKEGDQKSMEEYRQIMNRFMENSRYENIFLVDEQGNPFFSVIPELNLVDSITTTFVRKMYRSKEIQVRDFYYCPHHQRVHFEIFAPVINAQQEVVAGLVFWVDPSNYLYSMIQDWPTLSPTAETILIRVDNDTVKVLNQIKGFDNSRLQLSIPHKDLDTIVQKSIKSEPGMVVGNDYTGKKVLADFQKVPGTPWFLAAKVDLSEVFHELKKKAILIGLVTVLFIILIATMVAWIYYSRQRNLYRELLHNKSTLYEYQEEMGATLYSIGDGVISTDRDGLVRNMNPVAEQLTGWKEQEARGRSFEEVFHLVNEKTREIIPNPVLAVIERGNPEGLPEDSILIAKDGRETPISDSGAPILDPKGNIRGVVMVFSDQTAERLHRKLTDIRLRVFEFATSHSLKDTLQKILDEICDMTGSPVGFFHFVLPDQDTIQLQTWSSRTEKDICSIPAETKHYRVEEAGVWADSIRLKRSLIHNDFQNLPGRKGLPEGHVRIIRELVVPVLQGDQVVGVLGIGNRQTDYTEKDVESVRFLAQITWEVAESKINEEKVRDSEAKLSSIFRVSPGGIGAIKNRVFMEANPKLCDMLGYTKGELIGKNSRIVYASQEEYERVGNSIYGQMEDKGSGIIETEWMKKNGEILPVYLASTIIDQKDPNRESIFTVLDLGELNKTKEELKLTEEITRLILNNSMDAILQTKPDGSILNVNRAACSMFQLTEEEILRGGRAIIIAPDDPRLPELLEIRARTGQVKGELTMLRKGKIPFEAEITSALFSNSQGEVFSSMIIRDITWRKHDLEVQEVLYEIAKTSSNVDTIYELLNFLEMELQRVLPVNNVILALKDPDKPILKKVSQGEEFSWPIKSTIPGQIFLLGDSLILDQAAYDKMTNEKHLDPIPCQMKSWLGVPIRDARKIIGVLMMVNREIDHAFNEESALLLKMVAHQLATFIQRNQMIQDLVRSKEKAEESDRLKSAFLANISHEIRTPMNGLLGFLQLLAEPGLGDDQRENYVDIVNKSGQRLMATINDIVEVSKIEVGQIDIKLSEVNLKEMMDYHLAFFRIKADEKTLSLNLADHLSGSKALVSTDKHKIYSILTNLLNNAIKFTRTGGITFGNRLEGDSLIFYVHDTGVGIPADQIKTIFDRFVQVENHLSRFHDGSGLGLSIVKSYLEVMGGRIWVESEEGKGSQFYFSVPYCPVKDQVQMHETTSAEHEAGSILPMTILIAEDDDISAHYLDSLLKDQPFTILHTTNGEDTVWVVRENPDISLVLMDLKMPVMNGFKATQEIRKFNRQIPIIAQTAYAMTEDRDQAIGAGCNDFISKPIDRNRFFELIRKYGKTSRR
ncbi:MAG: PAS domain S-box protein [Bacteroidales bacterium]|nr:PAS domain S-box protein [Bacteroidales bacterium]MDD3385712.1 PAS domain S-box protein [Bacteroidales bacterium]